MNTTYIYLIRHAEQLKIKSQLEIDEEKQINNEKIILSIEGEKEAEKLSKLDQLKGIEELWTSNYVRAIATAKYIARQNNLEINIDKGLNERKLGNLEGQTLKFRTYTEQQLVNPKLKGIDGESCEEVIERVEKSIQRILQRTKNRKIAIVSHGAAIKFYLSKYCEIDEEFNFIYNGKILFKEKLKSPDIIKLEFENGKIKQIEKILF